MTEELLIVLLYLYSSIRSRKGGNGDGSPVLCMHVLWPLKHPLLLIRALFLTFMESDLSVICFPHPDIACSNSAPTPQPQPQPRFKYLHRDKSVDKYKQEGQHELDFRQRKPLDDGRRTKMKREKEKTDNNHSSGKNPNSSSSSLHKQPQPHRRGGGFRGRLPRPGFDLQTDHKLYKTSVGGPNLQARPSVNEKKLVNWQLACFMSNGYLTRGTLLGRPWPLQDSNHRLHGINDKSKPKSASFDHDKDGSRREKKTLYHTLTESLRAGDVHLPGLVNPSQLAAWLGLD